MTLLLALLACGVPAPPDAPDAPGGGGGGGGNDDDTAEPCGECTLTECDDPDESDALSEEACESAADDQGCADWEWAPC